MNSQTIIRSSLNAVGIIVLASAIGCGSAGSSETNENGNDTTNGSGDDGSTSGSTVVFEETYIAQGVGFVGEGFLFFTPSDAEKDVVVTIVNDVPESVTSAVITEGDQILATTPLLGTAGPITLRFTTLNTAVHSLRVGVFEGPFPITYIVRITEQP